MKKMFLAVGVYDGVISKHFSSKRTDRRGA